MRHTVVWACASVGALTVALACSTGRTFEKTWARSGGVELAIQVPHACSVTAVQSALEQRLQRRDVPHDIQVNHDTLTLRVAEARIHSAHLCARHEFFIAPVVERQRVAPTGEQHWYPSDTGVLRIAPNDRIGRDHIADAVMRETDWGLSTRITFDDRGTTDFASMSTRFLGQQVAFVYDDRILSAPQINEPIHDGQVQIIADRETLTNLTIALTTPPLPCDLTVLSETTVTPP